MSTHNACFHGEIRKLLCGYSHLSRAMFVEVIISILMINSRKHFLFISVIWLDLQQ